MKRSNEVLYKVFNLLKDDEVVSKLSNESNIENSYEILKEELGDITEKEYREAINTMRENNGEVTIKPSCDMELTDAELECVSGGVVVKSVAFEIK